jgi:hypothetical protein
MIEILENIISFEGKEDEILEEITNQSDTQEFLIKVLQDQLFETGADGNGDSLGKYSFFTIQIKKAKGQPTDRITLVDTGDFYDSYFIDAFKGGFIVDANGEKDDTNLFEKYGNDILKPDDETLEEIGEFYKAKLYEYLEKNIFC